MSYEELRKNDLIFALDIGTRSVIGVLGRKIDNKINIEYIAIEYHQKRVMYNGQVHDIEGVAEIVKKVKLILEEKAKCTLNEVSIAAAGRSLRTTKITIDREIDSIKEIDKDLINSLEVEGLQKAQYEIENQSEEDTEYFCVGYTVINYYINDGIIINPIGHKGNKIKLDILATFLPQIVVDSLYAVTSKLNLEVRYMTLEPIAAIEAAIPQNARLLNLALVDIGAGTSDVAITKDGTVVAYGMTSFAGDFITEEIAKTYLLDFDTAESLKINLSKEKIQKFSDIIGISYEVESEEILKKIEPAIKKVANLIAANIIDQNGKSPSAVFLIGGGSQVSYLNKHIAKELDLPVERVAVRGIETIQNTIFVNDSISGPEYITPIGILAKAIDNQELDFINIYINKEQYRLFQTKKLKVMDALVLAGFNPRNLIPKRGKSINITVNGNEKILYGQYGEAAEILINGKISNIESSIKDGDIINVRSAKEGQAASYLLKEVLPLESKIFINEKPTLQIYNYTVNNENVDEDTNVNEGDSIEYCSIDNVEVLCKYMNITFDDYVIKINDHLASSDELIKDKDYINIEEITEKADIEIIEEAYKKELEISEETTLIKCNDKLIEISKKNGSAIFVDIFDHIDFDRSKVKGKLVLLLNERNANYTDIIKTGDEIRVYWDN